MIRPIDLQTTILSAQNVPAPQRAEEGTRTTAQAAQAAFAAELTHRDESVAPATEVLGNRIDAKPDGQARHDGDGHKHQHAAPFDDSAGESAAEPDEPPHIVDFTA
ncbi:MAG: hypothetical protein ABSB70_13870 [Candidatus Velthaea sp.]|jgi:hypothetical protein